MPEIITDKDDKAQIRKYEEKFGMSSNDFIVKAKRGEIEDTFETNHWYALLRDQQEKVVAEIMAIPGAVERLLYGDGEPGSYRCASGVIPWKEGDELPEDTVRRCRDA